MTSVPNWIPRAVIYETSPTERVVKIIGWRATKTQVVVTAPTHLGPVERRFKLDGLTEITGKGSWNRARLLPPDDNWVIKAKRAQAVRAAHAHVRAEIEKQFQDNVDAETAIEKLFAVRIAVDEAIAIMGEVL